MTPRKTWLIVSAALAVAVYALMWIGYASNWNWLTTIDSFWLDIGHRYSVAHPGRVAAWNVFCTVLGPTAFRLMALIVIVFALVRRNVRVALFLVISVELSGLLTEIGQVAGQPPAPRDGVGLRAVDVVPVGTCSRRDGRRAGAADRHPCRSCAGRLRVWLIALGAVVVLAIGVGRVVLNVHHPSDVLAGWAFGYVCFVACAAAGPAVQPDHGSGRNTGSAR